MIWRTPLACAALLAACTAGGGPERPNVYTVTPVFDGWLYQVTPSGRAWGFYLYLPEGYDGSDARYPLLVYLQGWGNFGVAPNPALLGSGPLAPLYVSDTALDPAGRARLDARVRASVVIAPRLPYYDRTYADPLGYYHPDTLQAVVDYVTSAYRIDPHRLYVTGLSEGGGGTWAFAWRHPEEVAAIVPISAGLSYPMVPGLKELPIWIFHSFDDGAVPHAAGPDPAFDRVTGVADVLRDYPHVGGDPTRAADADYTVSYDPVSGLGPWTRGTVSPAGRVTYTLYATGGHDAWTRTYANADVWAWLYARSR